MKFIITYLLLFGAVSVSAQNVEVLTPDAKIRVVPGASDSTKNNTLKVDSLRTPPSLGQIINEQFANKTNFTESGTGTFTITSNTLSVASASGSIVYTNIAKQTAYGTTNLEDWVQTCQVTVGTITATSFGVGIGVNSVTGGAGLTAFVNLSSGSQGILTVTANGVSTSSTTALTVSAGHVLTYTLRRAKNLITFTVFNANNNLSQTVLVPMDMGYVHSSQVLPTGANFTIFALGGTHVLDNWVVKSDAVKNSVLFIGDSIFEGYNNSNSNNRAIDILAKTYQDNFTSIASQSNTTADFSATEILALAPKKIIINLGINNIGGGGQSAATAFTNLQSLISSITALTNPNTGNAYAVGTDIFLCTILPRESNLATIQTFNGSIRSTYTSSVIELEKPFLNASGTAIDSTLYADVRGSATHPNDKGNQLMAAIIGNYQPLNFQKKPYAEEYFTPVTMNSGSRATIGNRFTNSDSNALVIGHTDNNAQLKLTQVNSGLGVSLLATSLGGFNVIQAGNFINGNYIAYSATPSITYMDATTFRWYMNTGATPGSSFTPTELMRMSSSGLAIGTTTVSAKLNVLSTTEQVRTLYDASNYYSTTVGSTGVATFDAVGSGSSFSFSDPLNILSGSSTTGALNIQGGGFSVVAGADNSAATRTNVTNKVFRMAMYPYTNANTPSALLYGASTSTANTVNVGGGTGSLNGATDINFYTAANNNTLTGTLRATINSTGIFNTYAGSAVASASTITPTGNLFHVTGTTNITSVSATGITAGTTIKIIFDGALTFTNGGNLKIGSDFITTADDMIVITWDGTSWFQETRAVN